MNWNIFWQGRESDKGNLETVAKKLVMLRFVPNYIYLQTSSTKQAEARAAAGTLCTLLAVPAVTEAAAQGILLAWAYGESVMDVRSLLDGQKAAITKDDTNWQLSLSGLMKLGTDEDTGTGMDVQDGMGYKDYMRMLLFLEGKERMSMPGQWASLRKTCRAFTDSRRSGSITVQEEWRSVQCVI